MTPTHLTSPKATQLGIILMLIAVFLFTMMDAVAKGLVQDYGPAQVVWARFAGQAVLVAVFLRPAGVAKTLQTSHPWLHLLRSACQLGATSFFFLSLAYIGLAEATALADINPILITLGAALVLGEKLERHRVLGVVLSMVGALIIIRPGSDVFSYSALLPVACAFCYAANAILTRYIGRSETPWSSLLHAAVFGALMTSLLLPWFWRPVQTSDIPAFLVLGLLGTGAQFCIIRSYSIAEASVVAPFAYIGILFAIVWGVVLYQDYPDVWTIIGALVIVGSGLYVWRYELVRKTTKTTGV